MAKRTKKQEVTFADPLNWKPRVYVDLHPYTDEHNRRCPQCARAIRWTKSYMKNINGR